MRYALCKINKIYAMALRIKTQEQKTAKKAAFKGTRNLINQEIGALHDLILKVCSRRMFQHVPIYSYSFYQARWNE